MEKIKSRWTKNYIDNSDNSVTSNNHIHDGTNNINGNGDSKSESKHSPPPFELIHENLYLDKRKDEHSKCRKVARRMVCDCHLSKDERKRGVMGCLDDCLNRMLMIECGPRCKLGDLCSNKRFQRCQSAQIEVFKTRKKGWGLRTIEELPQNTFIMEYIGEVIRSKEFSKRVKKYTKQKIKHHYFMALHSDEIIDATNKGNLTRFINHSCEPNCETQKWTVNGELRIGFFTLRTLQPGEEITFDYQFQRYGKRAQKCYCGTPSCRGIIGGNETTLSLNGNLSPPLDENSEQRKDDSLDDDIPSENKFDSLTPSFKIPKLSRLQRLEIEKKIESDEVNDDAPPTSTNNYRTPFEHPKTPFTNRNYFKPAIVNGLVAQTTFNKTLPVKRRYDSLSSNNIDLTPAPKMSKEEHRQQFEMSVRLRSYYEAMEKHPIGPKSTKSPTIVVLANDSINLEKIRDDELAFSLCDYGGHYEQRDRELTVEDVIDVQYPYPGIYYMTPNGEAWFATVKFDRRTQQPKNVILNLNACTTAQAQWHSRQQQQ